MEVHAANGYLIDQFLRDGTNKRTDAYGGSVENRTRLLAEVFEAVTKVYPAKRVGVRFSPFSKFNDMSDSDPMKTFTAAITRANDAGLGYVHLVEGEMGQSRDLPPGADMAKLRAAFSGAYMANTGYDRERAIEAVASNGGQLAPPVMGAAAIESVALMADGTRAFVDLCAREMEANEAAELGEAA